MNVFDSFFIDQIPSPNLKWECCVSGVGNPQKPKTNESNNCTENAVCRFVDFILLSLVVMVSLARKINNRLITIACLTLLHFCFWVFFRIEWMNFIFFDYLQICECALCIFGDIASRLAVISTSFCSLIWRKHEIPSIFHLSKSEHQDLLFDAMRCDTEQPN